MSTNRHEASISIVTPSLNQGRYLAAALKSVRGQGWCSYEHIVLDGGSSDQSVEVLRSFGESASGEEFWWRSSPDGGQSAALNEGFAKSSGDIIGWLNADDCYRPGCFEQVAKAFADHPDVDVLYGDYTFIDELGRHRALRREIEFNRFILRYHRVLYIPTTATFFRRRIFDEGNFLCPSLHYAMDLEFFLRLADAGYKFQHLAKVLADFRVHPESKSVLSNDRQRSEHLSVVLRATPLARLCSSLWVRHLAWRILQLPAGILRYSEKLMRGLYRSSSVETMLDEAYVREGRAQ